VRINTKTKTVELLKIERDRLSQARDVAELLAKHTEGEVSKLANEVCRTISELTIEINKNEVLPCK
jgi:hypothetical protein